MAKGRPEGKRKSETANTIERRIGFFRADAGADAAGNPHPIPWRAAFEAVAELPFTPTGRYLEYEDGNALCCWVDRTAPRVRAQLSNIRRTGLPKIDEAGTLSALELARRAGLAEQTHIVCFPNGIIGAEFNFFGPRAPRLARYLPEKAPGVCPPLRINPLLRQDVAAQLARMKTLRVFEMKVRPSFASTIRTKDENLADAIDAAQKAGDAQSVEIILRPTPYARDGSLRAKLLSTVRWVAKQPALRDEVDRFQVKGVAAGTGEIMKVDVLSDDLVTVKSILKADARSKAVDSASAYAAIEEAYNEMKEELEAAAALDVSG